MEFSKVVKLRRSIREFTEEQITEEQLGHILFAGMAAPISRKDYSSIQLIVVQDKALIERMVKAWGHHQDPFYGAPTLIIVASKKAKVKNVEYLNVGGVIENMLLTATDLGLGSIYLTSFLRMIIEYKELTYALGIGEMYAPIGAIGVGYGKEESQENNEEEIRCRMEIIRR